MSDDFFMKQQTPPCGTEVFRFAIVASRYNNELVEGLVDHTCHTLRESGCAQWDLVRVPGAQEVPFAAHRLASSGNYAAIIALAVIVAGDTNHHEVLALSTAQALQAHSASTGIPMINGILCTHTPKQAQERALGAKNRGREFALSALHMARLSPKLSPTPLTPSLS